MYLSGVEKRPIRQIVHGSRPNPKYIVLHTMESEDISGVESWFRDPRARGVGAHFGVGKRGRTVQWADTRSLVYHAAGANTYGIGVEQAGSASYSRARWLLRLGQRRAVAKLIARLCKHHGLGRPSRHNVRPHSDFPLGGHHDPGKGYPLDRVIALARIYYDRWY